MKSAYFQIRRLEFWFLLVFVAACMLHFIHFFFRTSMWFDELTCALNVRDHSFIELATQPLDYNQIAPVGFLLLEKLAATMLGVNDLAFRFFPFLFSIASLILFGATARRFFEGITALAAFTLCAGSVGVLFYGAEAKQYAGDIAASLFIVWSAIKLCDSEPEKSAIFLYTLGGMIAILCSFPAACIAFISLSVVLLQLMRRRIFCSWPPFLFIATGWGTASFLLMLYAWMVMQSESHVAMNDYWSRGFIPAGNVFVSLRWIVSRMNRELNFFLTTWMAYSYPFVKVVSLLLMILSIPGIVYLVRKYTWIVAILFSPLLTAILLSAFKVLPFDTRVAVYATWPLVFSGMSGIVALGDWLPRLVTQRVVAALGMTIACPILLITIFIPSEQPPFNAQPMQLVLRDLKSRTHPDDVIFVYFKSRHALNFYGEAEGISDYKVGGNYPDAETHLRQLDSLKGSKRVWFVYSQWTPQQPFPDTIKSYLGNVIGKEIDRIADPHGGMEDLEAAAYLYDLTTARDEDPATHFLTR